MIKHYDLFAGIGGFYLALDTVFNGQPVRHIFCEWDPFCTAVLKKHWPEAEYWGDIAELVADTECGNGRRENSQRTDNQRRQASTVGSTGIQSENWKTRSDNAKQGITILTGGFPCQPFSQAGRRKGTVDDRYKWPEMFAVIRNVKPDWVIAENVAGLVTWNEGMVLETVCADLESESYEVWPLIIPAVAVGAPHRRDRVWVVAHCEQPRLEGWKRKPSLRHGGQPHRNRSDQRADWNQDWPAVAQRLCRLDDGLPARLGGLTGSDHTLYPWWRRQALKAYGNAIVPQVAEVIFRGIKETFN